MVGEDVRQVESEIDACIRQMPLWNTTRDLLLQRLMGIWRDSLELAHVKFAHAMLFKDKRGVTAAVAMEAHCVGGVFQALKWAMEYAPIDGSSGVSDEDLVTAIMNVAQPYQMLVDALKLGNHGKVHFAVDGGARILTVYEGGNLTGHDASIVSQDHASVPFHNQHPFVDDSDQLTSQWSAGQ